MNSKKTKKIGIFVTSILFVLAVFFGFVIAIQNMNTKVFAESEDSNQFLGNDSSDISSQNTIVDNDQTVNSGEYTVEDTVSISNLTVNETATVNIYGTVTNLTVNETATVNIFGTVEAITINSGTVTVKENGQITAATTVPTTNVHGGTLTVEANGTINVQGMNIQNTIFTVEENATVIIGKTTDSTTGATTYGTATINGSTTLTINGEWEGNITVSRISSLTASTVRISGTFTGDFSVSQFQAVTLSIGYNQNIDTIINGNITFTGTIGGYTISIPSRATVNGTLISSKPVAVYGKVTTVTTSGGLTVGGYVDTANIARGGDNMSCVVNGTVGNLKFGSDATNYTITISTTSVGLIETLTARDNSNYRITGNSKQSLTIKNIVGNGANSNIDVQGGALTFMTSSTTNPVNINVTGGTLNMLSAAQIENNVNLTVDGGAIGILSSNINLGDNFTIAKGSAVRIAAGVTYNYPITNNGTLYVAGNLAGYLINTGRLEIESTGNCTVDARSVLNGEVNNAGTLTVQGNAAVQNITNSGTLVAYGTVYVLTNNAGGIATIYGQIREITNNEKAEIILTRTAGFIASGLKIDTSGTLRIIENGFTVTSGNVSNITVSGTVILGDNGNITLRGVKKSANIINEAGTMTIDSDTTLNGTVTNNATAVVSGTIETLINNENGVITLNNGGAITNLTNNGRLNIQNNATYTVEEDIVLDGTVSNNGTLTVNGTVRNLVSGQSTGSLTIGENGQLYVKSNLIQGTVTNNGQLVVEANIGLTATVTNNGSLYLYGTVSDLTNSADKTVYFYNGASIANFTNNGTFYITSGVSYNVTSSNNPFASSGKVINSGVLSVYETIADLTNNANGTIYLYNTTNITNFVNNGTFVIQQNSSYRVETNKDLNGTVVNNGTLNFNGTSLTNKLTNNGVLHIDTNANYEVKLGQQLGGTVINAGTLNVGGILTNNLISTGTLNIKAGASYIIEASQQLSGKVVNQGILNVNGRVNGTIENQEYGILNINNWASVSTLMVTGGSANVKENAFIGNVTLTNGNLKVASSAMIDNVVNNSGNSSNLSYIMNLAETTPTNQEALSLTIIIIVSIVGVLLILALLLMVYMIKKNQTTPIAYSRIQERLQKRQESTQRTLRK